LPRKAGVSSSLALLPLAGISKNRVQTSKLSLCMQTRKGSQGTQLPPGWQEFTDPSSGNPYYMSPEGTTQWERPSSDSSSSPAPVSSEGKSARQLQMERVMERQKIQDREKQEKGPLALASNRVAVILGVIFIGAPLLILAIGYLAGVIPNPFDVCIEGGTNC